MIRPNTGFGLLILLTACGTGSVPLDDAGPIDNDGGVSTDADITASAGLIIEFRAGTTLPADVGGTFELEINERVSYDLKNVQAVGEAAPGDDRTTLSALKIDWREPEPESEPWPTTAVVSYPDAPVGTYSNLVFRLEKYDFRGELDQPSEKDFEIRDELDAMTVVVDLLGAPVVAGRVTTVVVDVDMVTPIAQVDWAQVSGDGETLVIEKSDPQAAAVRGEVLKSFVARPVE